MHFPLIHLNQNPVTFCDNYSHHSKSYFADCSIKEVIVSGEEDNFFLYLIMQTY